MTGKDKYQMELFPLYRDKLMFDDLIRSYMEAMAAALYPPGMIVAQMGTYNDLNNQIRGLHDTIYRNAAIFGECNIKIGIEDNSSEIKHVVLGSGEDGNGSSEAESN